MNRTTIRLVLERSTADYRETSSGFIIESKRLSDSLLSELADAGASVRHRRSGFKVAV